MARPPAKSLRRQLDEAQATVKAAMIAAAASISMAAAGGAGEIYERHAEREAHQQQLDQEHREREAQRLHEERMRQCEWAVSVQANDGSSAELRAKAETVLSSCLVKRDV